VRLFVWLLVSAEAWAVEMVYQDRAGGLVMALLLTCMAVQVWALESTSRGGEDKALRSTGQVGSASKRTHKKWVGIRGDRLAWGFKTCGDVRCQKCREALLRLRMTRSLNDASAGPQSSEEILQALDEMRD
jgi:hypothetical protein